MAAETLGARVCALSIHQGGVSRILASVGVGPRHRSQRFDFAQAPYAMEEAVVFVDADGTGVAPLTARYLGLEKAGFFFRKLVVATPDYALSLIVADEEPRPAPTPSQRKLLRRIADLMAESVAGFSHLLLDPAVNVTTNVTLEGVIAEVAQATTPAALLDDRLTILALSAPLAALLEAPAAELVGKRHDELDVPMNDAIAAVYRHALQTRVSPPDFEIAHDENGARRAYLICPSPFSPIDDERDFLHVSIRETTHLRLETQAVDRALARRHAPAATAEPSFAFLHETLVPRRAIRARNGVHFLTLRSWRAPVRNWQIKALKALKGGSTDVVQAVADAIAVEIVTEVEAMFGGLPGAVVAPMPCGHSKGACLSVELGRAVGMRLGLPLVRPFRLEARKGSSHPKENARRAPLTLLEAPRQPVIVVDDVATSGAHLEEAVKLLRPEAAMVFAVAWISGDGA